MPSYAYLARDERGKAVTGTMMAVSAEALAEQLKRTGYLVTRAREVRVTALLAGVRRVHEDELTLFTIQLAKMVQVGIPLMTALKTLEEQAERGRLRQVIGLVARDVESGRGFSEALGRHPRVFSGLFISMVHAGEASGRLDEILVRFAQMSTRQADLRQQLKTAMTYPCLLMVVGALIIAFLVTGVIPKFMKIFLEAGVVLPLPTLIIYQLSQFLRQGWLWVLLAASGLAAGLRAHVRTARGRRRLDGWALGLPVIGGLVRQAALSRFARTFETLVSSGVPILESLEIVEQTVGNVVIGDVLKTVHASVRQGGTIAEPLRLSREFPPMAVQLISVGEASGTLDHMLAQIADHYDLLLGYGIKRATAFVEPLFLGIMGGVVALIMASVLLPMFRLVNVIR